MKFQTTKRSITTSITPCFSLPYCYIENNLEFISILINPTAYTGGVYGWNCDVYDLNGFLITCGYRPFTNRITEKQQKRFFELCEHYKQIRRLPVTNKDLLEAFKVEAFKILGFNQDN